MTIQHPGLQIINLLIVEKFNGFKKVKTRFETGFTP